MITITDQFCGMGGSGKGAQMAHKDIELRFAMNHWVRACESYAENFPGARVDQANISETDPRRYGHTTGFISGPECTNHSVANGKRKPTPQRELWPTKLDPEAERSRATMWDVVRFAEFHKYAFIIVENVVDARRWRLYHAWINAMRALGYEHKPVYLNSMFAHLDPRTVLSRYDFAPQSRDRLYIVFWKKGNPAPDLEMRPHAYCSRCEQEVQAVQSWKKPEKQAGKYGKHGQYWYRCPGCTKRVEPFRFAALNALDFSVPIVKIGEREAHGLRPLKEKTLARIQAGAERFRDHHLVVDTAFSVRVRPVDRVLPTQSARQTFGFVQSPFLVVNYTPGYSKGVGEELATDRLVVSEVELSSVFLVDLNNKGVAPPFIMAYNGANSPSAPISEGMPTVTGVARNSLVEPAVEIDAYGFRMLKPHEIKRGMGMGDDFIALGTQREQVKLCGNAVTPIAMRRLVERCVQTLQ